MIQLELGLDSYEERLHRKCALLERQIDRMRKGQFALISEIKRMASENKAEIEMLKSNICKHKVNLWD